MQKYAACNFHYLISIRSLLERGENFNIILIAEKMNDFHKNLI